MVNLFFARARVGRVPNDGARMGYETVATVLAGSLQCTNLQESASVEVEQVLEAHGEPGLVADGAQPGQHAGRERHPVQRVVADREGLPRPPPRITSWCATRPRTRSPCTRMPSTSAPRAPSRPVEVASGTGAQPGLAAGGRDQLRRTPRGAGRRVGLVGVVQLDDLDRLEERRGLRRRTASSAPRRSRSSGRSARRRSGASRQPASSGRSRSSSKPVVPTTAWMPWLDAELEVVHHHVGVGEVDDRLRRRRRPGPASVVVDVERRHQLEVVGCLDRAAHLGADLAPRARARRPVVLPSRSPRNLPGRLPA